MSAMDWPAINKLSPELPPNYSQQFGYKLDDAPSDWSGKVRVEVTDLEFE